MKYILIFTLGIFIFSNCKKEEDTTPASNIVSKEVVLTTGFGGIPGTNVPFSYYSFETGQPIPASEAGTKNWDFGISFSTLAFNSGFSGPGNAGVIFLESTIFSSLTTAPETGYLIDNSATDRAVKNNWYIYNSTTRTFTPKAGHTFAIRTANGKFAKMEILKTDYIDLVAGLPTKVQYTFRYTYQANGTRNF
jgi:hypothetical protein